MFDEVLARQAFLAVVRFLRHPVRPRELLEIGLGVVGANQLEQLLDAGCRRRFAAAQARDRQTAAASISDLDLLVHTDLLERVYGRGAGTERAQGVSLKSVLVIAGVWMGDGFSHSPAEVRRLPPP